ncbi:MAG: ribosome biogenesis GTPase Der [Nitrospirae bacterium]|nr:MAG: ribosome biogenesis GTPase Der [Nitrospirota bacterium]
MALVAIVGRPNVGKSTLFNRIVGRKKAIVEDTPGVTRDRLYEHTTWGGKDFLVVDTGGIDFSPEDDMVKQVKEQALSAIEEADVIIFMMDAETGVHLVDRDIIEMLRRYSKKKTFYVVNKVEGKNREEALYDFYSLGIEPKPISALKGYGVDELMDEVVASIKEVKKRGEGYPKIAIVGRPNVGKSSLVNALLSKERMIVSPKAGTTRDAVDSICHYYKKNYILIDTAGIKRRRRLYSNIDRYSYLRTMSNIDRCDVAIVMLAADEGIVEMDKKIAGFVDRAGKGMILLINKWDLIEDKDEALKRFLRQIREELWFIPYAPVITVSAKERTRITKIFPLVDEILENRRAEIKTSMLNEILKRAVKEHPPPYYRGKKVKLTYMTQIGKEPPSFLIFSNRPEAIGQDYLRYIERVLREDFPLTGTPVRFYLKKKE